MRHLYSLWLVLVLDLFIVVVVGFGAVTLALDLNVLAVLVVAFGAFCVWLNHLFCSGYRDPHASFVELGDEGLRVQVFEPFKPYRANVPYDLMESIDIGVRHTFLRGIFGAWPTIPKADHVDIHLREKRFRVSRFNILSPRVQVVHLDVREPREFVEALHRRLAERGMSIGNGS